MSLDYSSLRRLAAENADESVVQKVRSLYLFEDADPIMVGAIVARCPVRTFPADAEIIAEGAESDGKGYVVIHGKVRVSIGGETVAELSDGAIFGEYALVSNEVRTATVTVAEPTECLVIDEAAYVGLSDETNRFNEIMLDRIEENAARGRGVFAT